MPWLRRLRAGLSPRSLVFDASSVHVRFVVGKAARGQVSVRLYLVCIIPPMFNAHLLQEGQTVEIWEPSKKQRYYGNRVAFDRKGLSLLFVCSSSGLMLSTSIVIVIGIMPVLKRNENAMGIWCYLMRLWSQRFVFFVREAIGSKHVFLFLYSWARAS